MIEVIVIITSLAIGIITALVFRIKERSYVYKKYPRHFYFNSNEPVCTFRDCVDNVIELMRRRPNRPPYRVLGLDCEFSAHSGKKGDRPVPATLQLATPGGYAVIFQLKIMEQKENNKRYPMFDEDALYNKFLPSSISILKQILEDASILKVGVGVMNDARYLEERYGLMPRSCLDVRFLAQYLNEEPKGLGDLASKFLHQRKLNLRQIKGVSWDSEHLPEMQLEYAANDARYGVDLFLLFNKRAIEKQYPWIVRLFWNEKKYWERSIMLWEKFIGKEFILKKEDTFWSPWVLSFPILSLPRWLRYAQCESASAFDCNVCGSFMNDRRKKAILPEDYGFCGNSNYLSLCERCLNKWKQQEYRLREILTEECGAPLPDYNDNRLERAKYLVNKIIDSESSEQLRLNFERELVRLTGLHHDSLTLEPLGVILNMECWPESEHGQFVRHYFECFHDDGRERLRRIWYCRFLNDMDPKHLPSSWQGIIREMRLAGVL